MLKTSGAFAHGFAIQGFRVKVGVAQDEKRPGATGGGGLSAVTKGATVTGRSPHEASC